MVSEKDGVGEGIVNEVGVDAVERGLFCSLNESVSIGILFADLKLVRFSVHNKIDCPERVAHELLLFGGRVVHKVQNDRPGQCLKQVLNLGRLGFPLGGTGDLPLLIGFCQIHLLLAPYDLQFSDAGRQNAKNMAAAQRIVFLVENLNPCGGHGEDRIAVHPFRIACIRLVGLRFADSQGLGLFILRKERQFVVGLFETVDGQLGFLIRNELADAHLQKFFDQRMNAQDVGSALVRLLHNPAVAFRMAQLKEAGRAAQVDPANRRHFITKKSSVADP